MILGAAEPGRDRLVTWSTARKNDLMERHNVDFEFKFNGNIILITNHTQQSIQKYAKQWTGAFNSRFTPATCMFNKQEKFAYTRFLVEQTDMLGKNCVDHKYGENKTPGYPAEVVAQTIQYLNEHYPRFHDLTPRLALKIADTIYYNTDPSLQKMMLGAIQ